MRTRRFVPNIPARKVLGSVVIVGAAAALIGAGFSAFTATTTNTGNSIASGTVAISDSDGGSGTLYSASNQAPGSSTVGCMRVTYTGSITASAVKLYVGSTSNGANYNLTVERGSGLSGPASNMNCTGFTQSSTPFNATLDTFPTAYGSGIDGKASAATWATNDTVDYRFTISVVDDATPNAHTTPNSTGAHTFTWEARS
jgi:hypothetical protein